MAEVESGARRRAFARRLGRAPTGRSRDAGLLVQPGEQRVRVAAPARATQRTRRSFDVSALPHASISMTGPRRRRRLRLGTAWNDAPPSRPRAGFNTSSRARQRLTSPRCGQGLDGARAARAVSRRPLKPPGVSRISSLRPSGRSARATPAPRHAPTTTTSTSQILGGNIPHCAERRPPWFRGTDPRPEALPRAEHAVKEAEPPHVCRRQRADVEKYWEHRTTAS